MKEYPAAVKYLIEFAVKTFLLLVFVLTAIAIITCVASFLYGVYLFITTGTIVWFTYTSVIVGVVVVGFAWTFWDNL